MLFAHCGPGVAWVGRPGEASCRHPRAAFGWGKPSEPLGARFGSNRSTWPLLRVSVRSLFLKSKDRAKYSNRWNINSNLRSAKMLQQTQV